MEELHRIASSCNDDDSYMYGKLLEFLRVSSLDPEFLIKCPDLRPPAPAPPSRPAPGRTREGGGGGASACKFQRNCGPARERGAAPARMWLLFLFGAGTSLLPDPGGAELSSPEAFRFVATRHTSQPPIAERRGYLSCHIPRAVDMTAYTVVHGPLDSTQPASPTVRSS
jgi:hypothetical protein